MKATIPLAGFLALLLLLPGCAPGTAPAAVPPPVAEPVQAPSELPAGGAAATVNGQAIPMAAYQAQWQTAVTSYAEQPGVDLDSPEGQTALVALRQQVLEWLIDQVLVEQAAHRQGIVVDEATVDAEVEQIRNQNPAGFAAWLEANGFSEESFRAQTRMDLLSTAVRDRVTAGIGGQTEQVRLRHILVGEEAQARALLDQLRQGTATFEALAREYSYDEATQANGGDIGFLPRGVLPEGLENAGFALQPGQVSEPVESQFGWHLLQMMERDPAREIPPEMLAALQQEAFVRWLNGERDRAQIERLVTE